MAPPSGQPGSRGEYGAAIPTSQVADHHRCHAGGAVARQATGDPGRACPSRRVVLRSRPIPMPTLNAQQYCSDMLTKQVASLQTDEATFRNGRPQTPAWAPTCSVS